MNPPLHTLPSADGLWTAVRLAPGATAPGSTAVDNAAIPVKDGLIAFGGPREDLPPLEPGAPEHDCAHALVTPGLIDCHTRPVYGGQPANEFALRLGGASYEELAKAGGGIASSAKATRAAREDALLALAAPRLPSLLNEGVCGIEIKSGSSLNLDTERTQLRVARRLGEVFGVAVITTFLDAHALPPEFAGRSRACVVLVCDTHLPPLQALREAGVPMAVASDHNPGTSPALSLMLMLNMASTLFRLTAPEALAGVTHHPAQALGLQKTHGTIAVGMPANFVLWPLGEVAELVSWPGRRPACRVVRQGRIAVQPEAL